MHRFRVRPALVVATVAGAAAFLVGLGVAGVNGSDESVPPSTVFAEFGHARGAADDTSVALTATLEGQSTMLPFTLDPSSTRLAWEGAGFANERRAIYLLTSTDEQWVCYVIDGGGAGASCNTSAKSHWDIPYKLSILSDGGPDRATRIEFAGIVSPDVATVVVKDTSGATHEVDPVNQTFYWAPAREEIAAGVGLAAVSFLNDAKEVIAERALPPF